MNEVIKIAHEMQRAIEALKLEGQLSGNLIQAKAESTMKYKQSRAVHAVRAKGEGMQVTLIKHHAEGEAAQEEYDMIVATESLKAHWVRMDNLKAQLNGLQSINRHLSTV